MSPILEEWHSTRTYLVSPRPRHVCPSATRAGVRTRASTIQRGLRPAHRHEHRDFRPASCTAFGSVWFIRRCYRTSERRAKRLSPPCLALRYVRVGGSAQCGAALPHRRGRRLVGRDRGVALTIPSLPCTSIGCAHSSWCPAARARC